jgi:hypothetical protein
MLIQFLSFGTGLVAFFFYAAIFLFLMRLHLKIDWFVLQIVIGSVVHVFSSVFFYYTVHGFLYWYALGVFSVCWFFFFTLSTAIYVSISAKMLRTIDEQPEHALSIDDIFNICIRQPFEARVKFLITSKQVKRGEIGYRITDIGAKNALRVQAMRRFWGMAGSGLYSLVEKQE